jgi:ABC-type multidrug transport system ATPase subunit
MKTKQARIKIKFPENNTATPENLPSGQVKTRFIGAITTSNSTPSFNANSADPGRTQIIHSPFRTQRSVRTDQQNIQLSTLRSKIIAAIQESEHYWLLFKFDSYGIAGFLPMAHKKIYIELIFFPPHHPDGSFIIHSPNNSLIDFSPIYQAFQGIPQPEPSAVLSMMDQTVREQLEEMTNVLEEDLRRLRKIFIVFPHEKLYQIRLFYPSVDLTLWLDVTNYPEKPRIWMADESQTHPIIQPIVEPINLIIDHTFSKWEKWMSGAPPNLVSRMELLEEEFASMIKAPPKAERDQYNRIMVENVHLGQQLRNLSFVIRRTQTLGIYANSPHMIDPMFQLLTGVPIPYNGTIDLFGNIFPQVKNIRIELCTGQFTQKEARKRVNWFIKQLGSSQELLSQIFLLDPIKDRRLNQCSPVERVRLQLSIQLSRAPDLLLLFIPDLQLSPIELEQFGKMLKKTKEITKAALIISGPRGLLTECDQLLSIQSNGMANMAGEWDQLLEDMPQGGDVVLFELKTPIRDSENLVTRFPGIRLFELRKGERFKLIGNLPADQMLLSLLNEFGDNFYSYKHYKPTFEDYLDFISEAEKTQKL